ncbi:uncharacterized protein LOC120478182 [Pimephales promelas]|uniref:uncharacterized protein LOC120478182 n=1 Tax=Pimephales promelas TaxID=90988 RepID=UPI001955D279|nr:uncharacterized protein LOC120478182 [Pimephales promelas]
MRVDPSQSAPDLPASESIVRAPAKMPAETCPLCLQSYARLGQHLVVTHCVKNPEERKLLLAMESGRVNARAGLCPLPACGKFSNRLDRHIRTHSEVTAGMQDEALRYCKRRVCLEKLTALRASDPAPPMVSTLDLEQQQFIEEDPSNPQDPETLEEEECDKQGCKNVKELLRNQVVDLSKQVDTLSETLRTVTRRYRILKRRSTSLGSVRIGRAAKRLLSSLGPEEEEGAPVEEDQQQQAPRSSSEEKTPEGGEEEKPSTSQQPEDPGEEQPHYPDHVGAPNEIVEEYRRHREGPDPGTKLKENVGCQVYRIKKFLAAMARGKQNLADFRFLDDTARIHGWVSSLRRAKMTVTTIQHYVLNVGCFMRFLSETPPQSCRLTKKALVGLRREMGALRKSMKCRELAAKAIPDLLTLLENEPTQKTLWRLYGHFAALLASVYGHRGGVLQNITMQEVLGARKSTSEKAYLINVANHKTNMAFGSAQIVLTEEEFGWVNRLLRVKDELPGGASAKFLFFTSTPNPCKNLNSYFQEAWMSMGLPGCPTFTDVRTSIASHIKFTHSNDDRVKLSKFMCHDTRTADKFYVANLTPQQAMEHRRLFDTALEGEERGSPSKQPTSLKRKRPAKGKEPLKKKRRAPESSDEEMTSGSTTPEATKSPEYQESGTSSPDSSGHEEEEEEEAESGAAAVGSQEEEKAESGAEAVGSQEEEKAESGAEAVGSQEEEKAESGAEAVGSQEEEETTTPKKYPRRRGKATVLLTPLKCLSSTQRHVSPLKVKKAIFSPTSTTLVGLTRQKEVSKKVKEAIKKRRQRK